MPVKASEITHLTDARYFAAWEVAYLGFPLGSGGISPLELSAIREWIEGPEIVGEIVPGTPEFSPAAISELQLDGLQFGPLTEPEELALYRNVTNLPLLVEYIAQPYLPAEEIKAFLDERVELTGLFLLNFSKGGMVWADLVAGHPFTLAQVRNWSEAYPILLEIEGATPSEMVEVLPALKGFSVRGGAEEKVGYKDFDELDAFFEDLELAN